MTPLYMASAWGFPDTVKQLLDCKARVDDGNVEVSSTHSARRPSPSRAVALRDIFSFAREVWGLKSGV